MQPFGQLGQRLLVSLDILQRHDGWLPRLEALLQHAYLALVARQPAVWRARSASHVE